MPTEALRAVYRLTGMLSGLLPALALTGCAVGPDYKHPDSDVPARYTAAAELKTGRAPAIDAAWWERLDDPLLAEYVDQALRANPRLEAARARVREARALRRAAAGGRRPALEASADGQRFSRSENSAGGRTSAARQGLNDIDGNLFRSGFDARWEIDLFGRVGRAVEAADARLRAAEYRHRDLMVSLAAEVATTYTRLRGAQRRLTLAERNIRIQQESLEIVRNKHKSGLVPELDVHQARRQLAETRSAMPPLRGAIRVNAHALARLLAKSPGALIEELEAGGSLPATPDVVPAGLPAELLGRRADLRAARQALRAASAEVGVAIARLYPRISLTGSLGTEAARFTDVFAAASGLWSLGVNVTWPLFQGERLRAKVDAREAALDQAAARYRRAVLRTLEEVETNLVRYAESRNERDELAKASAAARDALARARALYQAGLTDFLTVLDAERAVTRLDDRLAATETDIVAHLVSLYKSLGGGWQAGSIVAARDP